MPDNHSVPCLFIAAATGQNIANVPPILEIGEPGRDMILWVESRQAAAKGFAAGSEAVLRRRGFTMQDRLPVPDEPGGAAEALEAFLGRGRLADAKPVLIATAARSSRRKRSMRRSSGWPAARS